MMSTFPSDESPFDSSTLTGAGAGPSLDFSTVERETVVTQDIPVRVLGSEAVSGIHQPRTRDPDVHIILPPLVQLKSVSDRFTRLAASAKAAGSSIGGLTSVGPRLELAANAHGCLRIGIRTDAMAIGSTWTGLVNPELDPNQYEGGEMDVENHPSTKWKRVGDKEGKSEEGWAKVRIDGRDWGKVMSVGRLGAERVIACFCDEHALILYVYLGSDMDDRRGSVLTVSLSYIGTKVCANQDSTL
jgi:HUS1 checkpoint protein